MLRNCGEFVGSAVAKPGPVVGEERRDGEEACVQHRRSIGWQMAVLVLLGSLVLASAWPLGAWSTYADAFSHLFGHALGGIIGSALALVWWRRAWVALVGVGLATLAVPAVFAWLATVEETVRPGPGEIKIVSLNTWHANGDLDRLQAYLEHEDADLVLLYEFGPTKQSLVAGLQGRYPFAAGCAESWDCSVAILSKHAYASSVAGRREEFDGPPRMVVTFGSGPRPLTVIGAHMMRPIDGPNGHLKEMRRVAGIARSAPGPAIVAGDFNSTWWSHSFKVFREESGLTHMGRYLPSWPSLSRGLPPQLNIDHVWVSKELAVTEVHLGPDVGSDHRPLVAVVRMPDGFAW